MPRKIPRGKGYDKSAILRHLKSMTRDGVFVTKYVKLHDLKLDAFMLALARYQPEALLYWEIKTDPKFLEQNCEECSDVYWPARKGSHFCSPSCSQKARVDKTYFGGRRSSTVGLKENVCQLCARHVDKGLSSHHIYGKGNDTENEYLLALCRGCHSLVSELALKKWIRLPAALEKLIALAYTQARGQEMLLLRKEEGLQMKVSVIFDVAPVSAP